MVHLGVLLIPSDFTNVINPVMAVSNNIHKMQNLAKKVSYGKINMAADLFQSFKKSVDKGFTTNDNKK